MKKQFLIYIFVFVTSSITAQLYEAGVFIGGSNYIGDVGPTTYINPNQLAIGGVAKFNYSPRITFRGTLTYSAISANNDKVNRPVSFTNAAYSFNNRTLEGALGMEFSFFKYSLSKSGFTQTPYIIVQAGFSSYNIIEDDNLESRKTSFVLPFGLGYKMKLAENVGIAFETTFHYTFKDGIDGNNHTIPSQSFGNPNSNDWYVFTGISLVYAFGRPGCYTGVF
tara:strand:+ start:449249 stop:449917 length:669 start_codon:yes stop_codon:yes gene_type:complete